MSSASSLLVTQLRNNPVIPLYMCPAGFALTVVSTFSLVQGFPAQSCCSQHGRSYQRQPQQRLLGAHQHYLPQSSPDIWSYLLKTERSAEQLGLRVACSWHDFSLILVHACRSANDQHHRPSQNTALAYSDLTLARALRG